MKCRQCNKTVDEPCKRSDCGINAQTIKAETRRIYRNEQAVVKLHAARDAFTENFLKVAAWSEAQGWQKKEDRQMLATWAASTDQGKIVIQTLARSL